MMELMPTANVVGCRLRAARKRAKLTMLDAEIVSGVSKATICDIERGKRYPNLRLLLMLCAVYGCDATEIVRS